MSADREFYFDEEPQTERRPAANGHAPPEPPLDPIVAIDWTVAGEPRPREFIVPAWLAPGHVTMLSAEGGSGKTTLAVQLCMSTALGRPWLGIETTQAVALMMAAEDDDDELHRKVLNGVAFMAVQKADLAGRLHLQGRVGMSNMLLAHTKGRPPEPLPLLAHIEEQAKAVGARLIVIDNAAQFFGGEENARAEVTAFINALAGIARRLQAAVLLLSHPPKNGADYSGSTAWHAAVRCLWTLQRPQGGDEADGDVLVLCRAKSNYAKPGEKIRLRWIDGTLRLADEPVSAMDASFARHNGQAAFLAGLDELTAQQRTTSHAKRAGNYAPTLIVEAGLANGASKRDLERAMNELLRDGRIKAGAELWKGADRKLVVGLARSEQPETGAGRLCGAVQDFPTNRPAPRRNCGEPDACGTVPHYSGDCPHRTAGGGEQCGSVEQPATVPQPNRPASNPDDAELVKHGSGTQSRRDASAGPVHRIWRAALRPGYVTVC